MVWVFRTPGLETWRHVAIALYTSEINSVIDMIIFGVRYLLVLTILFMGLWFIAQNLYRRAKRMNRAAAVRAGDFEYEQLMTNDMPYASLDTLSQLLRAPFGIMTVPDEVYSYRAFGNLESCDL